MFDCHCDLLTYIYNNRDDIEKVRKKCSLIYNLNNITGAIFNLFFMSKEEMKEELGIEENELNIIEMLKIVNKLLKENNIVSSSINYIYGIEGLDYLEKISDIDILYNLGVRSVNVVWNNKNKFGGGSKVSNDIGLTNLGEELIEKLVKEKIMIDLSHANQKTFSDIIEKCKELVKKGFKVKVFASHSNCKKLCDVNRNLTDKQLIQIKELNGIIGLVEYKNFVSVDSGDYEANYLKQINYLKALFDGVQNIAVSTDDELYYNRILKNANIYQSDCVGNKLNLLLLNNGYSMDEVNCILNENAYDFIIK